MVDEGESCLDPVNCAADEFTCVASGKCISSQWLCDKDTDCEDGSDESGDNCDVKSCDLDKQFQCNITGICVPASWECDGDHDCGDDDDSDEHEGCTEMECDQTQFTCDKYKCIPLSYRCDYEEDCNDGSDEKGCPQLCQDNQFYCYSDDNCIDKSLVCNGNTTDGCSDADDEANCASRFNSRCELSEFPCSDGSCIPSEFVCDGTRDCVDGSDENHSNCTGRCTSKERACSTGSHKCISAQFWCDGDVDCEDGSDEEGCSIQEKCDHPSLRCDDSKCVDVDQLCDGKQDCQDGSDEGMFCSEQQCTAPSLASCEYKCHNSPEGHRCICPPGQHLDPDMKHCSENHPCSQFGTCSQLCKKISRSKHKCFCHPGYVLHPDKFTCKSKDDSHPLIVFSNRHELRTIDIRRSVVRPLISNLKDTIVMDFIHKQGKTWLFWTDWADDKIYTGLMAGDTLSNIHGVVHSGLTTAEGLAVDWIGENLYWIQSSLDQIEVAKINGSFRQTLIAGNMARPRALALDPRIAILFWTDWDPHGSPRIESCSMDGNTENRKTVFYVQSYGGAWPNGLTIDYLAQRLYWTDARSDSIHTTLYDGNGHHEIIRGHTKLSHPFSVAIFESHIYWTDWRSSSVIRANKWNGSDVQILERTISKPYGIKVIHPSLQPKAKTTHPCQFENGNCSHLCLLGFNQTKKCGCPHVMKLSDDQLTCTESKLMLLFSSQNEIRGVDLDNPYHHIIPPIPPPYAIIPSHINFLASNQEIFWVDKAGHTFRSASVIGEDNNVHTVDRDDKITSLAVDWVSKTLYYSTIDMETPGYSSIFASKLDFTTGVVKILTLQKTVKDLIVLPPLGLMFWIEIDTKSNVQIVKKSKMDGSVEQTIKTVMIEDESAEIKSLTSNYDFDDPQVYWVEKNFGETVIQYKINENTVKKIFTNLTNITAVSGYRNKIYYARVGENCTIHVQTLSDQNKMELYRNNTLSITSMAIYNPDIEKVIMIMHFA